jgi:alcohol dehydrogenase (cytochrome c)
LKTIAFVAAFVILCSADAAEVTYDRLVHAQDNSSEWLTYWGDYGAMHFRDLKQINDRNVGQLRLAWLFQTG